MSNIALLNGLVWKNAIHSLKLLSHFPQRFWDGETVQLFLPLTDTEQINAKMEARTDSKKRIATRPF